MRCEAQQEERQEKDLTQRSQREESTEGTEKNKKRQVSHRVTENTEAEKEKMELVMGGGLLIGGGEFAELSDGGGNDFEGRGDFLWSGVAAEAEADAGAGVLG